MDNEERIAAVEAGLETVKGELLVVKASYAPREMVGQVADRVTMLEAASTTAREFHELSRDMAVVRSDYVTRHYLDERIDSTRRDLDLKIDSTRVSLERRIDHVADTVHELSQRMGQLSQRMTHIEEGYATRYDLEVAIRKLTWRMVGLVTAALGGCYFIARTVPF